MEILYLSSLCSVKEYERMFKLYGTTSSHASQKFNRLLVKGLLENGCTVEALTERIIANGEGKKLCSFDETEDGVCYKYLPRYNNSIINRIMTIWNAFKYVYKWGKTHTEGIIVCDIILGELSLAVWLVSKIGNIKTTAIVTDVPSVRAGENRKGIRAIPIKLKNASINSYKSYIFLTERMNTLLNRQNKPYVIIEGIVDAGVITEPNNMENKYEDKVIMMAGLLEEIYGVDIVIEAFHNIVCADAKLKFYGKGSSVEKIKEASIKDDRISYCGELTNTEIIKEEKKSTLLINPRPPMEEWTAYSFPSKNMEYMASGTPLVAFDLPCIPEEYKTHFYHFDQYTVEGIQNVLQRLLQTDTLELYQFGLKTQSWITETKNSKLQVKKYVEMIKDNRNM